MTTDRIITVLLKNDPDNDLPNVLSHTNASAAHILGNTAYNPEDLIGDFEWDDVFTDSVSLNHAQHIADDDGQFTVHVLVDAHEFMSAYGNADYDHYDVTHNAAFGGIGLTHSSEATVIAVYGDQFIVRYSTNLAGFTYADL